MNQIERTYEVVAQLAGCINQAATTLREIAGRFGQLEPLDALLAHVGMG